MSMVSCPKCGVANPEGSRFCRACGAPLPGAEESGRRCPMCGAMNPMDSVVCGQCQARLVPLAPEQKADIQEEVPAQPVFSEEAPVSVEGEPDWLSELRATMEEAEGRPEEPASEEMPSVAEVEIPEWLRDLTPPVEEAGKAAEVPEAAPPTEAYEEASEETVPDWLREVVPPSAPPVEEAEQEVELPEWLKEAASPAQVSLGEEMKETAVPDRLQEVTPPSGEEAEREAPEWLEAAVSPASEEAGETEAPEWAQEAGRGPFTEVPAEEADLSTAEPPEWLQEVEESPSPPPVPSEEGEVSAPPAAESGMPAWLLEAATAAEAPTEEIAAEEPREEKAGRTFISDEGIPPLEPGEVPDWLKELAPAEETPSMPEIETGWEEGEGLAPAEIPDWLQALRPREEGGAPEEPVETEGLLEGLRGTLPPSPAVEAAKKVVAIPSVTTKPASVARAELFQELLSRPVISSRRVERKPERGVGLAIQRLIVGLLLLAAILAPMAGVWLPMEGESGSAAPAMRAEVMAAYDAIEARVEQGTPVLVAVEYGPSEAEEIDLVARPVLQHVLDRGGRLILVSTRPEGPALADRLLSLLVGAEEREARVVNLGYQPGDASGVQGLLANLVQRPIYPTGRPAAEMPAMEDVTSVEDVGLILVLGGQAEDVLTWIEQTSSRYPDLPLVAGVSARVEVGARPYLEQAGAGALKGLVAGLPGATIYQHLRGVEDRHMLYYLQSVMLSQWVVAALMVVGMVVFLVGGKGR